MTMCDKIKVISADDRIKGVVLGNSRQVLKGGTTSGLIFNDIDVNAKVRRK